MGRNHRDYHLQFYGVLEITQRLWCVLGKHSTNEPYPRPLCRPLILWAFSSHMFASVSLTFYSIWMPRLPLPSTSLSRKRPKKTKYITIIVIENTYLLGKSINKYSIEVESSFFWNRAFPCSSAWSQTFFVSHTGLELVTSQVLEVQVYATPFSVSGVKVALGPCFLEGNKTV